MMLGRIGVAIDIGTTTVVVHLVEMKSGARLKTASRLNAQSPYGADITSRIQYCIENGHELLTKLIREQISSMIIEVCETAKENYNDIESISIAANTVMQHLVVGYSPNKMGVSPYKTTSLFGQMLPAWEGMPVNKNAMIYYTPSISAFVGGDITAGILAAGIDVAPEPALFIDVGTNGEIVLKNKGDYICCSTAAGPAFEGAEIDKGMIAEDGAIDHLWLISNDQYNISVIGGGEPKGLCGSGLLDTLAMLLDTGAVDETGRLLKDSKYWLTKSDVGEGVYISASDIRKLQLAKAAIAAGVEVLLHFASVKMSDVKTLALAGGFGCHMDLQSATRIGLINKALQSIAVSYGNTAGDGAQIALRSEVARLKLDSFQKKCEYINLSATTLFNEKFYDNMGF